MDGIVNLNKPAGSTSHDVVAAVRRLIPGIKVGHAGTLDPAATGVLPLCLGKATRVAEYLMDLPKGYRAGVELGTTTDTEDAQGNILERKPVPALDTAEMEALFGLLTGELEQITPAYSAAKYRGKPLYRYARKGAEVPRKKRRVTLYRLKLLQYNPAGGPHLLLEVECSRGTYIRALAAEIGRRIGCGAHLYSLERYMVGPFTLEGAVPLELLQEAAAKGEFTRYLTPMDRALTHLPALTLDGPAVAALKQGRRVPAERLSLPGSPPLHGGKPFRIYDRAGRFQALAEWREERGGFGLKTVKFLGTE